MEAPLIVARVHQGLFRHTHRVLYMTRNTLHISLMTGVLVFGVWYNNVLRWFPFPAGRSLNELSSLDDNLVGIVVNSCSFALLAALTLSAARPSRCCTKEDLATIHNMLLYVYCGLMVLRSLWGEHPSMEVARALSAVVMFVSANKMGKLLGEDACVRGKVGTRLWMSLVGSLLAGFLIGVFKPDSVNWGWGHSTSFENQYRAEFFFLYTHPWVTLSLRPIALAQGRDKSSAIKTVATASTAMIMVLSFLTRTRSHIASVLLVYCLSMKMPTIGRGFIFIILIVSSLILPLCLVAGNSSRIADDLFGLATVARIHDDDPNYDVTTGRSRLNEVLLGIFLDNPVFGAGPDKAREIVRLSDSTAKVEHGYVMHLASYGAFALLFLAYVLIGTACGVLLLFGEHRQPVVVADRPVHRAVGAAAVTAFLLGFVGLFGSSTGITDWFGVFFISLSCSLFSHSRRDG